MSSPFPRSLRLLLWVLGLACLLYFAAWFAGRTLIERSVRAELEALKARGQAEYQDLTVAGFPNRFDLALGPLSLASADGSFLWSAPGLQLFALMWQPTHLLALLPQQQQFRLGGTDLMVNAEDLRGSASLGLSPALPLHRATVVGKALDLRWMAAPGAGFAATIAEARLAAAEAAPEGDRQRLGLELLNLAPDAALKARIDPRGALPAVAERLHLDATLTLDRSLDRAALEVPPRPLAVAIDDLSLDWGALRLRAKGQLGIDDDGRLEGRVDLSAAAWRELLSLAVEIGLITPEVAPTYGRVLEALAKLGRDEDEISLPLVFHDGRMTLGPLPLGRAPRL